MMNSNKPVVLVIAGHDPSGGAGIQADIESIANAGCHAATVITSLTAQNTKQVADLQPQKPAPFRKQIRLILEDMAIAACKIGLIGNVQLIDVIENELSKINAPIVVDPVINSSSGKTFSNETMCEKMAATLLPIATIVTPNSYEAKTLSKQKNINKAAKKLLTTGVKSVLITGADEKTDNVTNSFYTEDHEPIEYHWQRLRGAFHGSGCTLSSRIAALLAMGKDLKTAVEEAQAYTWNTLKHGIRLGQAQTHPHRFFHQVTL